MGIFTITSALIAFVVLCAESGSNFPPPLSCSEEKKLFELYVREKDDDARLKLIEHNLRLVAHIVRKYYGSYENGEELVSIGTIGLIKAVDSFKTENGARFATYGAKCIQNEILMHFRREKKKNAEVSINETIDTDRDGNPLTYMDIIKTNDTIAEDIDTKMKIEKAIYCIEHCLDKREKDIIIYRYGLSGDKPLTQRETAEKLGISRSYISRLEKSALETIAESIGGK